MKVFTSILPGRFINPVRLQKVLPGIAARLLMMLVLSLGVGKSWGQSTYNLVTSTAGLSAGSKYLIVSTQTNGAGQALGWQNTSNRPQASITVAASSISTTPASISSDHTSAYEITLGGTTGAWTLYDPVNAGFLRASSSSSNNLVTGATADWTITFSSNAAVMTCVTGGFTRNILRYNSASSLFSCYSTGQAAVYLYQLAVATPPTLTAAVGATVDAPFNVTFTDDATWRAAITSVTVGGTTLTAGYSASSGQITFTPSASTPASLLQSSGTKSIVVIATGYTNATVSQTIGSGADNKLAISVQPTSPPSNGAALATQPVVFIRDQYGNATTSSATVTATTGAGAWTPGGGITANGTSGTATFAGLTATSAASVTGATIIFTSPGLTSITSAGFNIPAPAGLTPPTLTAATATVDADFDITYADDAAWRGAITTVKYGAAILSAGADYTLAAGILTLKPTGPNAALHVAGTQTVTVSATGYDDATVSQTIGAGAPNKLAMNVQPTAPATNGGVLAVQPSVFIRDQYDNATTSTATITATTGGGAWTPGGNTIANGTAGTATFSGLTASSASAVVGATITFTSPGLTSVTSGAFNIPAPGADHITFVIVPATGITGAPLGTLTVEARRPDNSVDGSFTGNVTISKATGPGAITGALTKAAVAGVATFTNLQFGAAGSYTLFADASTFSQITSSTIAIADPIAMWSFEGVTTNNTGTTANVSVGSVLADIGSQTTGSLFSAVHTSASTTWSNPGGNGTGKSVSSTNWAVGDYYQFKVNTTGYYNIAIKFDQTGSNTGPRDFKIQYSLNGSSFTDFASYSVPNNAGSAISWSSTSTNLSSILSYDLSAITALNGAATAYFRITDNSTTAINGTTVATTGTGRLDNFIVTGTLMPVYYPRTTATDLSLVSDWTDDVAGLSGTSPADFTSANQIFNISRNGIVLNPWTISGSASSVLLSAPTLELGPSARLIVGSGSTVNFNGQPVTLRSTAAGTASIGTISGTLTGATNVTVERYIKLRAGGDGRAYRLLTPSVNTAGNIQANWMETGMNTAIGTNVDPLPGYGTQITGAGGNANGFDKTASNAASLYTVTNAVSPTYTAVGSVSSSTMNAKTGYFLYLRGDRNQDMTIPLASNMPTSATTLRATGTLVQGTQTTFTNAFTGGGAWNLVTNPYASPIDWSLVQPASSGITGSYIYWDPNIGSRGGFAAVTTAGVSTPATSATQIIQSGQAFFVESNGAVPAVSIQESHKTTGNNNDVFLTAAPAPESFRTELYFTEANGYRRIADGAIALYDNSYSTAVDATDTKEINNWDENIAIARDGKHLAIESRPVIGKSDDLPIFMNNMKKRSYEFEFTPTVFTNTSLKAELVDRFLGTRTL